jgi:LPXTG-site transpeptidase (sortase) family protein
LPGRVFVFLLIGLTGLALLTSPTFLRPYLQPDTTSTPTMVPTVTPEPTATLDPFARVPTATPLGNGLAIVPALNTSSLGLVPPTNTPASTGQPLTGLLPNNLAASPAITTNNIEIPPIPTPAGIPPERLQIPRLGLDVPIEPVGLLPSSLSQGVFEWGVPDHRAAGWLNTSAPFGQSGNTVLDGHHNIKGEVFRELWTLQNGDKIVLSAGDQSRSYVVDEVLILPERNQPLEVRLANARYIQPTNDERLTLVTCWPYEDNTHRTVVIALPDQTDRQQP